MEWIVGWMLAFGKHRLAQKKIMRIKAGRQAGRSNKNNTAKKRTTTSRVCDSSAALSDASHSSTPPAPPTVGPLNTAAALWSRPAPASEWRPLAASDWRCTPYTSGLPCLHATSSPG
jgi:hypothetical protein